MYDVGKIDDKLKNLCLEQVDDEIIPNSRHFIIKCIRSFLKTPNEHLIRLYEDQIAALEHKLKEEREKFPKVPIQFGSRVFE